MNNSLEQDSNHLHRMREEIMAEENTPTDIEPLRRHSAADIVVIPESMRPVVGQENALNLMLQMWSVFDVKISYHSDEVKIVGDTAFDRGWAKETLRNKMSGETLENLFNYLWVSRKDESGVWKQTHVIWNQRPE